MVTINQFQTRSEEKHLEEYVKLRLGKSSSGAPLVRTPTIHIDVPSNPEKSDFEEQLLNKNGLNGESSVWHQSYTSQVLWTFEKRWSPKPFGQTKNGLVSGRLACTSSKTEILNKIGI